MLRRIHQKLGTAGFIISIVALIAAVGGTAYAAGGLTKSQEKQVTKIAKKYAGKPGANGAAGANGTNGTNGAPGVAGKEGPAGKEGSPWTAGGTLPSGQTEYGVWTFHDRADPGALIETSDYIPISFSIPLKSRIEEANIEIVGEGQEGKVGGGCEKGTVKNPVAKPGFFCLYTQTLFSATLGFPSEGVPPLRDPETNKGEEIGKTGAQLQVYFESEGEYGYGYGVWAVTAP